MKKQISLLLTMLLVLSLVACGETNDLPVDDSVSTTISESAPDGSSESAESIPAPVSIGNPVDYEAVASVLNRVLEEKGRDEVERFDDSGNGFDYADYDTVTIYRTTTLNNYNVILLYLKDSVEYQVLEMGDVSIYTIQSIGPLPENPDVIRIYAESRVFGGDNIFMNYPATIYYTISQGKVTAVRYDSNEQGIYGMVGTRDWQQFDECTVDGKKAVFTFKMVEGGNGNGYDGPEIISNIAPRYDREKPSVIGFRNTQLNLTDDFIAKIQAMEGVASAEFAYIQSAIFTGTQLVITPKPDYAVTSSIKRSIQGISPFDSFTIRVVRYLYDEPDFTDALGFKVILQNGPPMIGGELYGAYIADMAFQLDKTNIAHLRVSVDVGESINNYDPAWYDFETEKEVDINGITVKIGWNMSGHMTAIWSNNGYAMNFYMNEGETELSVESFQNFVEWCVKDVVLEPTTIAQ